MITIKRIAAIVFLTTGIAHGLLAMETQKPETSSGGWFNWISSIPPFFWQSIFGFSTSLQASENDATSVQNQMEADDLSVIFRPECGNTEDLFCCQNLCKKKHVESYRIVLQLENGVSVLLRKHRICTVFTGFGEFVAAQNKTAKKEICNVIWPIVHEKLNSGVNIEVFVSKTETPSQSITTQDGQNGEISELFLDNIIIDGESLIDTIEEALEVQFKDLI